MSTSRFDGREPAHGRQRLEWDQTRTACVAFSIASTIILSTLPAHAQSASSAPPSPAPATAPVVVAEGAGEAHLHILAEESTEMTVATANPVPQLHHCTTPCDLLLPVGEVSMSVGDHVDDEDAHRTHLVPGGREVQVTAALPGRQVLGGVLVVSSILIGGIGVYLTTAGIAAFGHPYVYVGDPPVSTGVGGLFMFGIVTVAAGIAGMSWGVWMVSGARPQMRDTIGLRHTRSSFASVRFGATPTASGGAIMLSGVFW